MNSNAATPDSCQVLFLLLRIKTNSSASFYGPGRFFPGMRTTTQGPATPRGQAQGDKFINAAAGLFLPDVTSFRAHSFTFAPQSRQLYFQYT